MEGMGFKVGDRVRGKDVIARHIKARIIGVEKGQYKMFWINEPCPAVEQFRLYDSTTIEAFYQLDTISDKEANDL